MSEEDFISNNLSDLADASEIQDGVSLESASEDVARVRKTRASVTERSRAAGDNVASLLNGLLSDSNAEIEAELARKEQKAREAAEKAKREEEEAKKRAEAEAEARLEEEKRKLEEKEQRRLQMLAEMEKKRRLEAGEVDEEEEARKRAEAEAEAARIASEKAREEAEDAALRASNQELSVQIRAAKDAKKADEDAKAAEIHKAKVTRNSILIAAAVIIASVVSYYFLTLKAPDYYVISRDYQTLALDMKEYQDQSNFNTFAMQTVRQSAPKVSTGKSNKSGNSTKKDDKFTITNALDSNTIVH